jgi:hypothetical protein
MSFAQGIRELHDAELFPGRCHDHPHFAGANSTIYPNLQLQI